mmetsp:Transcript_2672/g.6434  ORF Transcript_2672/g.6434 Transcript_2672/m.6434 type:complete len:212 (-) Transcript_2672:1329-1964(-)
MSIVGRSCNDSICSHYLVLGHCLVHRTTNLDLRRSCNFCWRAGDRICGLDNCSGCHFHGSRRSLIILGRLRWHERCCNARSCFCLSIIASSCSSNSSHCSRSSRSSSSSSSISSRCNNRCSRRRSRSSRRSLQSRSLKPCLQKLKLEQRRRCRNRNPWLLTRMVLISLALSPILSLGHVERPEGRELALSWSTVGVRRQQPQASRQVLRMC